MKKFMVIVVLLSLVGCRWVKQADDVAFDEFGVKTLLAKYEWFKDAAAKLDSKLASIEVAESRLKALEKMYEGVPRRDWARTDAEQYSVWTQECAGLKMSYNDIASQYNSRMSKENYKFCEVGDLPKGATKPLPRDFKPYLIK